MTENDLKNDSKKTNLLKMIVLKLKLIENNKFCDLLNGNGKSCSADTLSHPADMIRKLYNRTIAIDNMIFITKFVIFL